MKSEDRGLVPDAFQFRDEYANLKMPVVIVAGNEDRLIDTDAQSERLHRELTQGRFHRVPRTGHMVHQTATAAVMSAIKEVAEGPWLAPGSLSTKQAGPYASFSTTS